MRRISIGDIHGGLRAFKQLLTRINYDMSNDKLYFLGDYVDGWTESSELIEELIYIKKHSKHKPVFVAGNHDIWCRDWLNKGIIHLVWSKNGGEATVKSYINTEFLVKQSHKKFFNELEDWHVTEDNILMVHAGWDYRHPFQTGIRVRKPEWAGIGAKECHWNRNMFEACMMNLSKFNVLNKFKEIYIGHTTTENWGIKPTYPEYKDKNQPKNGRIIVPINRFNLWNLDTGAGWSGKLTAMDIDTKEYWQSDFVYELYPEEIGRNNARKREK